MALGRKHGCNYLCNYLTWLVALGLVGAMSSDKPFEFIIECQQIQTRQSYLDLPIFEHGLSILPSWIWLPC